MASADMLGSHPEFASARWTKSSASIASACVEVAYADGRWGVRDSKDRAGPVLVFNQEEWDAFSKGVSDGEFTREVMT